MPLLRIEDKGWRSRAATGIYLCFNGRSAKRGSSFSHDVGSYPEEIGLEVDPAKLASAGVTLEDVRSTLMTSTTNAAKGTINEENSSFTIAANDQIIDAEPFNDQPWACEPRPASTNFRVEDRNGTSEPSLRTAGAAALPPIADA